jgi:hypothetical protein
MPGVRVLEVQLFERDVRLRMPFRFGVITLTEEPQAFLRVRVQSETGLESWGIAADCLAPKWFDKNPNLTNEDNYEQLRTSIRLAADLYLAGNTFREPFQWSVHTFTDQQEICRKRGLNGLIASFGPALLDRAILDAVLKMAGCSFYEGIQGNLPGIKDSELVPDLKGFDFDSFLETLQPASSLFARHTVGLVDPLTSADQNPSDRVGDGLPETLEEVVKFYGNRYFKVKLWGDAGKDVRRLKAISTVLDRIDEGYFVTLDGNEQYSNVESLLQLWTELERHYGLKRFLNSVLFIEQPIKREVALAQDVTVASVERPLLIDESDSHLDTFLFARQQGYRGITTKSCKGLYKSLINATRCQKWNSESGLPEYFMSGEDLTMQPGISVQQDLALVTLLGLKHLERNGHHYVNGMAGLPDKEQMDFLAAHPGLYHQQDGVVRLRVQCGKMDIRSLACQGFAAAAEPDWSAMREQLSVNAQRT